MMAVKCANERAVPCIPEFHRPITRSGDDVVWRDRDGVDGRAVVVDDILELEIGERIRSNGSIYGITVVKSVW